MGGWCGVVWYGMCASLASGMSCHLIGGDQPVLGAVEKHWTR